MKYPKIIALIACLIGLIVWDGFVRADPKAHQRQQQDYSNVLRPVTVTATVYENDTGSIDVSGLFNIPETGTYNYEVSTDFGTTWQVMHVFNYHAGALSIWLGQTGDCATYRLRGPIE